MAKARKAGLIQTKLGMVVFGDFFTGKSTLASQFAYFKRPDGKPFRVLYLDPESGSIDDYLEEYANNGVNLDNIYIVYTQSLAEVRQYIAKVKNNELSIDDITEETISNSLYTAGQPDPDIIVRPSGEYRLSNFMTWQSAYSEFWYSDILWPDFTEEDVNKILEDYQKRNRRFGGV